MYRPRKTKLTSVVLVLFIISWFVELQCTLNQCSYLLASRIFNLILIGCYYFIVVKKPKNNYFLYYFICILVMHSIFATNHYSITAMLLLSVSRILLIALFLSYKTPIDKKHLFPISLSFTVALSVIVYFFYQNTLFFYSSALATIFLIVLLSITLTSLSSLGNNKPSLYMFLAALLFMLSDVFFGSQKVDTIRQPYIISIISFYYLGYFLIIHSIKHQNTIDEHQNSDS